MTSLLSRSMIDISIALICAIIFAIDAVTPVGVAVWVFYLVPVVLCIRQDNPRLPYLIATVATVLIIAGYFVSPAGLSPIIGMVNRGLGTMILIVAAYLVNVVVEDRHRLAHTLWLEQGRSAVSRSMIGDRTINELARMMLHALATHINAQVGILYRLDGQMLVPAGTFATEAGVEKMDPIALGQGIAGEAALTGEAVVLHDVPPGYLRITSAMGEAEPRHVLVFPVFAENRVTGIVEFGFLREDGDLSKEKELAELVADKFGLALRSALYREHLQEVLEETRRQSEELQTQQEELRVTNEELHEQSRLLQESQATLETQQNELEEANVMLAERSQLLERQKADLQAATVELTRSNQYKSEFLANMSHELRTPLNSSLILSHMLAENKPGNLNQDQVRYARTIHSANQDLLTLINDILDLSKIEAGQVEVQNEQVTVDELAAGMRLMFEPVAMQRRLGFDVVVHDGAPASIVTDAQRLQQVLKNLLSNAFKFTHAGQVRLDIARASEQTVAFSVTDSGIGIAPDKQEIIFEAFRQADGSTDRTYGGTGLGLSISRELASLLGGRIRLQSEPGRGSVFTLELPAEPGQRRTQPRSSQPERAPAPPRAAGWPGVAQQPRQPMQAVPPPRESGASSAPAPDAETDAATDAASRFGRMILIVEDDEKFAQVLCELVRDMGFDCMHAATAGDAIHFTETRKPDAVLLDVGLPDQSGLSVLARLKRQPSTRHIPVHIISVGDYQQTALELGAIGYAIKPAAREEIANAIRKIEGRLARRVNRLLIVEDDATLADGMRDMLKGENTVITLARSATQALERLAEETFDCMVMDLGLPDHSGYELLDKMTRSGKYSFPPVIVYTGRVLTREEEDRLRQYAQSIIIKGAKSPERLLDEVSLFLHRMEENMPASQQGAAGQPRPRDAAFEGRDILIVEDDVRNIFALTSLLEPLGAKLHIARNGKEALRRLEGGERIDLVLMDLMMPEMDGLTAMREIRKQARFRNLPIIALTAKAMANDRKESLDAGASDYIAKPIDVDRLVALCKIWLPA
ncbi:response regulator [Noviherbaspirillum galbum]|uniref:Virulence sensor protein BvgS n=1 Tax=Noviherbaspirillum galbum TaxID=2709383 RepID=A0A6B3SP40_9BURK|nr:response regulator [Noviherbaspirillum galbum]NEX62594.1 response regulator [Noviherbaspirillum galbum]